MKTILATYKGEQFSIKLDDGGALVSCRLVRFNGKLGAFLSLGSAPFQFFSKTYGGR